MNLHSLIKKAALAGLAVSAGALIAGGAMAQNTPQTVTVSLATNSALTSADGVDADFGEYLVIIRNGETVTLTMDNTAAIVVAGDTQSTVIQTDATGVQAGTVTITAPTGADNVTLQMTHGAIVPFTDPGIDLTGITYTDTVSTDVDFTAGTAVDVVAVTGGTPETITFGHEISIDGTPDDTNSPHTASYDVSFAY